MDIEEKAANDTKVFVLMVALGWKPRLVNGVWNGTKMLDAQGQEFTLPPDFVDVAQFLFRLSCWGPLRGSFPGCLDRGKAKDTSRGWILENHVRPYINSDTGEWDGMSGIDQRGHVRLLKGSQLQQLRAMVMEGCYGNVPWRFVGDTLSLNGSGFSRSYIRNIVGADETTSAEIGPHSSGSRTAS
jgi:hypothetical protein